MTKLFGTDGISGEANQPPMTGQTALEIGRAVAGYFSSQHRCSRIIVGKDTRISGDMLEQGRVMSMGNVWLAISKNAFFMEGQRK